MCCTWPKHQGAWQFQRLRRNILGEHVYQFMWDWWFLRHSGVNLRVHNAAESDSPRFWRCGSSIFARWHKFWETFGFDLWACEVSVFCAALHPSLPQIWRRTQSSRLLALLVTWMTRSTHIWFDSPPELNNHYSENRCLAVKQLERRGSKAGAQRRVRSPN